MKFQVEMVPDLLKELRYLSIVFSELPDMFHLSIMLCFERLGVNGSLSKVSTSESTFSHHILSTLYKTHVSTSALSDTCLLRTRNGLRLSRLDIYQTIRIQYRAVEAITTDEKYN